MVVYDRIIIFHPLCRWGRQTALVNLLKSFQTPLGTAGDFYDKTIIQSKCRKRVEIAGNQGPGFVLLLTLLLKAIKNQLAYWLKVVH